MKEKEILLAAFDLDGTILEHESSWVAIHKRFKSEHKGAASLRSEERRVGKECRL